MVTGDLLGVCTNVFNCKRACIHDPEGGHGCRFFPGSCLRCEKGYKLKKGKCKKNGA
jgi:hypothetical protein